jgi:4-hydroxybenzoate polyprenyltransferase
MNTLSIEQYPVFSFRFLKAYIITMRPYLMFVSGVTAIAGMSFEAELELTKTILIFIAGFLSYGFGQALTDCFQIDTDSLSSPYRPLTQGIVNKNYFLVISSIGLLFCISVLAYYNPVNIGFGVLSGIGLLTYTNFKRKWWAGPFYNAWIVLVLFIMSYLAASGNFYFNFSNLLFAGACLTVFFGYANFVLTGYFKDITADRATSYNTLPVKFGRKVSVVVSDLFFAIITISTLIIVMSLAFDSVPFQIIIKAVAFIYTGIGMSVLTQISLHSVKKDSEAHLAIVPCVHCYILILSGLAIFNKPDWFIPLLIFYMLYIFTLKLRPAKDQI